jgi:hypothetical protein
MEHRLAAWQMEVAGVDQSVGILLGVKKMMGSPKESMLSRLLERRHTVRAFILISYGEYTNAPSLSPAYGCMTRVGITPPKVAITADDKRLKNGKPFPDPFLLAAKELGYDAKSCVVFEDSPSGIRAGVASGATVIALCTSHERKKIENCGAHFLVQNLDKVHCEAVGDQLKFTVDA